MKLVGDEQKGASLTQVKSKWAKLGARTARHYYYQE